MTTSEAIKADWAALISEDTANEIEPGEITAMMYAKEIDKSYRQASAILTARFKSVPPTVTRRRVLLDGHKQWAYRPIKKGKG